MNMDNNISSETPFGLILARISEAFKQCNNYNETIIIVMIRNTKH